MPRIILTDLSIKALSIPDRHQVEYWDKTLRAFGVRVAKGGSKTFVLKQQQIRYVLGRYPSVSLKEARTEAHKRIALKYIPQTSPETQEAVEWYLQAIKEEKRPNTLYVYELYLKRLPEGRLHDLTASELYKCLPTSKSAANLCFSSFKAFLSWCVERGHLTTNPLISRRSPHKTKSRDRLLTDDEIRLIWKESHRHNSFGSIVRLLILTGQRLSQISNLEQKWLHQSTIAFPASIMKGNTEHSIPLTPLTRDHLRLDETTPHISSAMKKFRGQLTILHWTLHDFRRYFSSTMAKLKVRQEVTERLLAHKTGGAISPIASVYNRYQYLDEMREALEKYHAHLREVCNLAEHP